MSRKKKCGLYSLYIRSHAPHSRGYTQAAISAPMTLTRWFENNALNNIFVDKHVYSFDGIKEPKKL